MKIFISAVFTLAIQIIYLSAAEECIKGSSYSYTGSQSTTKSGLTCQRWDVDEPHEVNHVPQDGGHHSYCRNPERDSHGTWCYTTDPSVRWEYCGIPKCDDSAVAIWASFDGNDSSSFFEYVPADPEYATPNGLQPSDISKKVFENAQFKALGVSKDGEEIFFTDVRNNYFGVFNKKTLEVERYLNGEADGIHAIAQDFVTGNFYYTDTKTKSVMVADRKFRAKISLYKSAPAKPRAIAILQGERRIVFSTYVKLNTKIRGAQIIAADLAGRNEKILFKSPEVVDVTGLATDGERIYWTDNLGWASRVMSSLFDGSNKVEHYFKRSSSFQDLALYSDYIYVTDAQIRYNYFDEIRYHVEAIVKDPQSEQVFTYTKSNLPHGIAILQDVNDAEIQGEVTLPLSRCMNMCQGVCIPNRMGGIRCACSFGFRFQRHAGKCVKFHAKLVEEGQPKKKSGRK